MNVQAASQQLIHEILAMIISQILPRVNNSVHISFHEVRNDVNVLVAGHGRRLLHIDEADDILVVEEFCKNEHLVKLMAD